VEETSGTLSSVIASFPALSSFGLEVQRTIKQIENTWGAQERRIIQQEAFTNAGSLQRGE